MASNFLNLKNQDFGGFTTHTDRFPDVAGTQTSDGREAFALVSTFRDPEERLEGLQAFSGRLEAGKSDLSTTKNIYLIGEFALAAKQGFWGDFALLDQDDVAAEAQKLIVTIIEAMSSEQFKTFYKTTPQDDRRRAMMAQLKPFYMYDDPPKEVLSRLEKLRDEIVEIDPELGDEESDWYSNEMDEINQILN